LVLVYDSEVVLSVHTHRLITTQEDLDNKELREVLDMLPMVRGDGYP